MLTWLMSLLLPFLLTGGTATTPVIMPTHNVITDKNDVKWDDLTHDDYLTEYSDEFAELFNSYETKWSKNGRLMIRQGNNGPYKFVKKGSK